MSELPVQMLHSTFHLQATDPDSRIRKRRCLPTPESGSCQLCKYQSIPCSLTCRNGQNRRIIPADDQSSSATSGRATAAYLPTNADPLLLIPPKPVCNELVELYFRLIHDGPHTLFHKPTFLSRLAENVIPGYLLHAVVSLSTR
jgi:hypothetical protein